VHFTYQTELTTHKHISPLNQNPLRILYLHLWPPILRTSQTTPSCSDSRTENFDLHLKRERERRVGWDGGRRGYEFGATEMCAISMTGISNGDLVHPMSVKSNSVRLYHVSEIFTLMRERGVHSPIPKSVSALIFFLIF
jgi:hypothetical protein